MASQCPVCNGLRNLKATCSHCFSEMTDGGLVENYFDPYGPYQDAELLGVEWEQRPECVHLVTCSNCGYDTRVRIELIDL